MTTIFVSYKSEDRERVRPLIDALAAEGLTVWWDVQIEGGAAWRATIAARLDAAACVIVAWSQASVGPDGHFVQDEASRAMRRGVYLPVGLDAVAPPLGFGQRQMISLVGWRGNRRDPVFVDLVTAARAMVAASPPLEAELDPAPRPPTRPTPRPILRTFARTRRSWWHLPLIGAGIAAVIAAGLAATVPGAVCRTTGLSCGHIVAPPHSIAVMPFANLSADPNQAFFADGLSEELLGTLAGIGSLHVAARTSSFKFKDSKDSSSVIGTKLGVAFILDGSVRRSGDTVRVNAQLVDAASGFERWSQTFDRDVKDVFAVQRGIAEAVASALKVNLLGRDVAALNRGGTVSIAANDAYLRGRAILDAGSGETDNRRALAMFDAAIVADPRFAEAHAARARALLTIASQFLTDVVAQRAANDAAFASATRAVALAPDLPESQASLAGALLFGRRDLTGARAAYSTAMRTGGGKADILLRYGLFASRDGAVGPGLAAIERATVLDPLNHRAFRALGVSLTIARRYPDAVAAFRQALVLSPNAPVVHAAIGDVLLLEGRLTDAAAEYALEPDKSERLRGTAIVLARHGDLAGSDKALAALVADSGDTGAYQQAQVRAQRGQLDLAVATLDRAFEADDPGVLLLPTDPLIDPLRARADFVRLLVKLNQPVAR